MKTIKKKVDLILTSSDFESYTGLGCDKYSYHFEGKEFIPNIDSLEFYIEAEEPETIKEFRKVHELSSKELVEWLNSNYSKQLTYTFKGIK